MKLRNKLSRRLAAFLLCAMVTVGALTMAAGAAGSDVTAQLSPDVTVTVDGTAQTFYNVNGDEVHPILYSGTTYLPVRAIGELMGKNVNWDASTRTVSLSGTRTSGTVSGTPDSGAAPASVTARLSPDVTVTVDGVTRSFTDAAGNTVYPLLYNGSVYLPIRAIGSLMGKSVSWDAAARTGARLWRWEQDKQLPLLRAVPGPQWAAFTPAGQAAFTHGVYRLTADCDRMACKLQGPAIQTVHGADILSDGIVEGSVQVGGNGQPIVMLADHQTTGGYAKIATVITADLPALAQLRPGQAVAFTLTDPVRAVAAARAQAACLQQVKARLNDFI